MKKREKFLLAFLISFCIIMGKYVYINTKNAIHEGIKRKENYEWLFGNKDWLSYEDISEDAKQYFEEEINVEKEQEEFNRVEEQKYCAEFPEECTEVKEHQSNIFSRAMDYFRDYIVDGDGYIFAATEYDITIFRIFVLTLIIYYILSLELKNKKQYFEDNIKIIVIISLVWILGSLLIDLHENLLHYNSYWHYTVEYNWYGVQEAFVMILPTYIVILTPNLIINLIKNRITKKIQIKEDKEK